MGLVNLCKYRTGLKYSVLPPFGQNESSKSVLSSLRDSASVCSSWAWTWQGSGALWGSLAPSTPKHCNGALPPTTHRMVTPLVSLGISWKLCNAHWQHRCQQYTGF